jgi:hypothetical protein
MMLLSHALVVMSLGYATSVGLLWTAREWPRIAQLGALVWTYSLSAGLCGLLQWGLSLAAVITTSRASHWCPRTVRTTAM